VVVAGLSGKARILHSLFGVNTNPDAATTSGTFVGISGTHKSAPFKAITTAQAVLALTAPTTEKKEAALCRVLIGNIPVREIEVLFNRDEICFWSEMKYPPSD
jgi:hypothetical protein